MGLSDRKFSDRKASTRGVSLLEVLVASVIIFVVLATAIIVYFLSVLQGVREIVDTEVKAISRSVEHALRGGARANLAPDRRSFWADVEGVRIFVPLPQPGQPAVELPDYNEDMSGVTKGGNVFDSGDVDWDGNGILNAPNFAKAEPFDLQSDGKDNDADGVPDDGPTDDAGRPEPFVPAALGARSPAYNLTDDDSDSVVDDLARYIFPVGLLADVNDGAFQEMLATTGAGTWAFQGGLGARFFVIAPLDEDLNGDGFVSTSVYHPPQTYLEAALVRNEVSLVPGAFYPDTYEDLDGNARISVQPAAGPFLIDVNDDTNGDFNEYAEDFNLNGFLDVPTKAQIPGLVYYHGYFGGAGGVTLFPGDPLSQGLLINPPGGAPVARVEPYQTANYFYASQIQQSRNFGYSLRVQRVEEQGGGSRGFGGIDRSVYRLTLTFYYDYAKTVAEFRQGMIPEPVRVQSFEVIVE